MSHHYGQLLDTSLGRGLLVILLQVLVYSCLSLFGRTTHNSIETTPNNQTSTELRNGYELSKLLQGKQKQAVSPLSNSIVMPSAEIASFPDSEREYLAITRQNGSTIKLKSKEKELEQ